MLVKALLIALVQYFIDTCSWTYFDQIRRPIFIATLAGLVLGDVTTGAIIGGMLEVIYLGVVSIGGVTTTDLVFSSTFAVALSILFGYDAETAIAVAIPMGYICLLWHPIRMTIHSLFVPYKDKLIAEDKLTQFSIFHVVEPLIVHAVPAVFLFLGVYLGQDVLTYLIDHMPVLITSSVGTIAKMLPAVGLGILLNYIWDNSLAIYLILGFALSSVLGVSNIFMAIVAVFLATLDFQREKNMIDLKNLAAASASKEDEEDIF